MQKIAEHFIQPYGLRALSITVPRIYASDNKLEKGDALEIYRDSINGKDVLIIIPKEKTNGDGKEIGS